jgi:lipopolysaccharide biosynthesis protein
MAREQGAVAWSKLPATLRRGLSIRDAIDAEISREWHHAGKYATEVHVYYLDQVEEFWRVIDKAGVTVKDLKEVLRSRRDYTYRNTPENMALMTVVFEAADAAETARVEITS